jgi:glycosyltransferase involved in cell wall biosynthesis
MKICFINPSVGTIAGGSETIVQQFAKHLSKEHEVTILTGKSRHKPMQKELLSAAYEVITVPFWPRFTPFNNFASKVLRRLTPYKTESHSFYYNVLVRPKIKQRIKDMDVISTHYWLDSRLFSNLAFKLGVPSVFHILGGPYSKEFFEFDKSTLYVAVSRNTQSLINNAHGINIEDVVTPGIPSLLFSDIEKTGVRRDEDSSSLLFVGRLQPSKGVFDLIEIYKRLLNQYPKLRLTIVGEGDIVGRLKDIIKRYNIEDMVVLTGALPYKDVFKYYLNSTVFVFPSKSEVFPLVSIEAMACGLPIVASDILSLRESTGGKAILVPPEDLESWVKEVSALLDDQNLRDELSKRGKEWVSKFTWEKKAEEYEKCLLKAREIFVKSPG